jgi:hypothetical protein
MWACRRRTCRDANRSRSTLNNELIFGARQELGGPPSMLVRTRSAARRGRFVRRQRCSVSQSRSVRDWHSVTRATPKNPVGGQQFVRWLKKKNPAARRGLGGNAGHADVSPRTGDNHPPCGIQPVTHLTGAEDLTRRRIGPMTEGKNRICPGNSGETLGHGHGTGWGERSVATRGRRHGRADGHRRPAATPSSARAFPACSARANMPLARAPKDAAPIARASEKFVGNVGASSSPKAQYAAFKRIRCCFSALSKLAGAA